MREIDKNESASDAQLSKAMRRMARDSPLGAPPEMAEMLAGKFRQHHARRKTKRRIAAAGIVACLAVGLTVLMTKPASPPAVGTHVETRSPQHRGLCRPAQTRNPRQSSLTRSDTRLLGRKLGPFGRDG